MKGYLFVLMGLIVIVGALALSKTTTAKPQATNSENTLISSASSTQVSGHFNEAMVDVTNTQNTAGIHTSWVKTFGTPENELPHWDIKGTTDGGAIIVSNTVSPEGNWDILVIKIDSKGNIQWQKTYGGSERDYSNTIFQTSDGGYIFGAGSFSIEDGKAWIVKLDQNGSIEWQKSLGFSVYYYSLLIEETNDGGYVVAGDRSYDIWVGKLDSNGNLIWQKSYDHNLSASVEAIHQTDDLGYIFVADVGVVGDADSRDVWVVKLTSTGNIQWQKTYGGSQGDWPSEILQTEDGNYIFAASTRSIAETTFDGWLVKLNSNGSIIWQKIFGGADFDVIDDILAAGNGEYVVGGRSYSFTGVQTGWMFKINSEGTIQWQKLFNDINRFDKVAISQASDSGFFLLGGTNLNGAGLVDLIVYKTSPMGDIPKCTFVETSNATSSETNLSVTTSLATLQNPNYQPTNTSLPFQISSIESQSVCYDCYDENDEDGDGLQNGWEVCGYLIDENGIPAVDLPAMGASPTTIDIFVEIDYMVKFTECDDSPCPINHSHLPNRASIQRVVDAFAERNIHLHVDYDEYSILHWGEAEYWGDLSRGNWILETDEYLSPIGTDFSWQPYRQIKFQNFTSPRWRIFHYALFAHKLGGNYGDSIYGLAQRPGSDFIIALGAASQQRGNETQQGVVFMHELGHNLSLQHGGGDGVNLKPNYLSVMNYAFQHGLYYQGNYGEIDYSGPEITADVLNEEALVESNGLTVNGGDFPSEYGTKWVCFRLPNGTPVMEDTENANDSINWNCNPITGVVHADINGDGDETMLHSYNDWGHLAFGQGCIRSLSDPNCINIYDVLPPGPADAANSEDWPDIPTPYSISFGTSGHLVVPPGLTATIPLTIANTGELTTTAIISQEIVSAWYDTSLVPQSIILEPDESITFDVGFTLPTNSSGGEVQELYITAFPEESPRMGDGVEIYLHTGLVASFEVETAVGNEPFDVIFRDNSVGDVTSWVWDFGDGSSSTDQNPTHTYTTNGIYTVSLSAAGQYGSDTYTRSNLIWVMPNLVYLPIVQR